MAPTADLFGNGDVDAAGAGGVANGFGVPDPFGDHLHAGEDRADGFAPAQALADGMVAAVAAGAGDDQVADAAQPREGFGTRAQGAPETGHLGQAAGDDRRAGVVPEAQSVGSPARDGPSLSRKRRIQKPEFSIQNWNPLTGNVYYYSDS